MLKGGKGNTQWLGQLLRDVSEINPLMAFFRIEYILLDLSAVFRLFVSFT